MKVQWEEDDIRVGTVYGKPGTSERWLIGYVVPEDEPTELWCVSLSDGLMSPLGSKSSVVAMLTGQGYLPASILDGNQ